MVLHHVLEDHCERVFPNIGYVLEGSRGVGRPGAGKMLGNFHTKSLKAYERSIICQLRLGYGSNESYVVSSSQSVSFAVIQSCLTVKSGDSQHLVLARTVRPWRAMPAELRLLASLYTVLRLHRELSTPARIASKVDKSSVQSVRPSIPPTKKRWHRGTGRMWAAAPDETQESLLRPRYLSVVFKVPGKP